MRNEGPWLFMAFLTVCRPVRSSLQSRRSNRVSQLASYALGARGCNSITPSCFCFCYHDAPTMNQSHGIDGEVIVQSLSPLVQCSPANATWTGGLPPFEVRAYALFSDAPRVVARTNESHAEWTCDYPAGTNVAITIWDKRNESIYYGYVPDNIVGNGTSDCLVSNATATHAIDDLKPTSSSSGSASSSAALSATSSSAVSPPSGSASASAAVAKSGSSNTGAIAGGVVGGVVGALLLLGLLFWLFKRRRRQPEESEKFEIEEDLEPTPITPFAQPPAQGESPADPAMAKMREAGYSTGASAGSSLPPTTPSTIPAPPPSIPLSPISPSQPAYPAHAEDAGPAQPDQLPPMYGNWKS